MSNWSLKGTLSGPLWHNPQWRYRLAADLRDENWIIRPSFAGRTPLLGALNLRRAVLAVAIESFFTGKLDWSAAGEFSHRDYRNVYFGSALTPELLLTGYQLKQVTQIRYRLWQIPERRFNLTMKAGSELGRIWSSSSRSFEKLQGGILAHWFPQSTGENYETRFRVRGGETVGNIPFDELYMLAAERDNDLWLRGHIGTREGKKGSAPLGKNYFLSNCDVYKNVYNNGLIRIQIGPLLDTGKIFDAAPSLAPDKWLVDIGAQARFKVLGVSLDLSYGKDLRTGNNALYATAGR